MSIKLHVGRCREVNVDDKDNDGDVNELQDSQLSKLAHSFIVHRVVLLDLDADGQHDRRNNVDTNNNQRRANNGRLLESVVEEPIFAVQCIVLLRLLVIFVFQLEFCEFYTSHASTSFDELLKAIAVHETDSNR